MEIGDLNADRRRSAFEASTFDSDRRGVGRTERAFATNRSRDSSTDYEVGDLTSLSGTKIRGENLAHTSEATCCKTFRPRGITSKS